jgi:hypothetical protein
MGYFSDVPTPVYYLDVRTKEQATIIHLGRAEKGANIDFQLPQEDVLKPLGQATSNRWRYQTYIQPPSRESGLPGRSQGNP